MKLQVLSVGETGVSASDAECIAGCDSGEVVSVRVHGGDVEGSIEGDKVETSESIEGARGEGVRVDGGEASTNAGIDGPEVSTSEGGEIDDSVSNSYSSLVSDCLSLMLEDLEGS